MPTESYRYPIELSEDPTANGGSEWSLRVDDVRVGSAGIFTKSGERPQDMLPRVLISLLIRDFAREA